MENKQDKKKSELLQILQKTEHDANVLTSKGREIVQQGQYISDLEQCTRKFIQTIPDDSFFAPEKWNEQCSEWINVNAQIETAQHGLGNLKPLIFVTNSTTSSSSTIISSAIISSLPSNVQDQAWAAYNGFEQLLDQSNLIEKIAVEIERLGLISPKGSETTLSLVRQANQAFTTPSIKDVAPAAVLIPIREAVNRALADLLPRRPTQEETRGARKKVRSICTQCGSSDVKAEQIERLASEAHDLNNLLSDAKQKMLSRGQVRETMNRALLFLQTLLQAVDEKKLR